MSDDSGRIAMLKHRTFGTDDSELTVKRFIYSNHLQSAGLELDDDGNIISYEEYHPYGTTSYQASNSAINAVAKRYRYTGKERDEESGLNYHGARYYAPWLCRWCAVDLLENKYAPQSPFAYCSNRPTIKLDPTGMGEEDLPKTEKNQYGESQVHQEKKMMPHKGGVYPVYHTVTPSGIPVSQGLDDKAMYRLAVGRMLHPGEFKLKIINTLMKNILLLKQKSRNTFPT